MPERRAKPKKPLTKATRTTSKRGPKPQVLEPFDGAFEQAIDRALTKKKPAGGWPKT